MFVQMNEDVDDVIMNENNNHSKAKELNILKSALKYYQSRSLTLDAIVSSRQNSESIPPKTISFSTLQQSTVTLYDNIVLLESVKECMKVMQNSLTCYEFTELENENFKRTILHFVEGVIYFSKKFMEIYKNQPKDYDIIEQQKEYAAALRSYKHHMDDQKNALNDAEKDPEFEKKSELYVYKINLIREMKAILIAFLSVNYSDVFQKFEKMLNPARKTLTVEDFHETWDVGLPA